MEFSFLVRGIGCKFSFLDELFGRRGGRPTERLMRRLLSSRLLHPQARRAGRRLAQLPRTTAEVWAAYFSTLTEGHSSLSPLLHSTDKEKHELAGVIFSDAGILFILSAIFACTTYHHRSVNLSSIYGKSPFSKTHLNDHSTVTHDMSVVVTIKGTIFSTNS